MIRPADTYVLLGMAASGKKLTFRGLAEHLHLTLPQVQRSLGRLAEAGLIVPELRVARLPNVEEFVVHALRYLAPGHLGAITAGVPAAWAAAPLTRSIVSSDPSPVWPSPRGTARGPALDPLHPAAVDAVRDDERLADLLAVADCLRAGDRRVRREAEKLLPEILRRRSG